VKVAKDEKDGDIRRLLRRVTNRAKAVRRQRSKSAHGHLQSVHNERSIDDAASKSAAVRLKLSNDELHTTSSPDLDKRKGFARLSRLRDEQKKTNKDGAVSSSRRVNDQKTEFVQQHTGHVQQSPALRNEDIGTGLERTRSRNVHPLPTIQPTKLPPQRTTASPLAIVPRSYCGIGSRSESVLLFPGHSRDILLKKSRERLASAGSNSSSEFPSVSSGRSALADESNTVGSPSAAKSAAAYLGSNADGHSPMMRRAVMRNRTGRGMKCWQRPESDVITEDAECSRVIDQENSLPLSLIRDENADEECARTESSTDVSPSYTSTTAQPPFPEFKKVDYLYSISPLSLSVQCGSDTDDVDGAHETFVVPTHRLTSKRVWNMNTHCWEDAVEQRCTDSVASSRETPVVCNFLDVALLLTNQSTGKIIFTRADSADKSGGPVSCNNTLQLANSHRNRCFYSENDIQNAARSKSIAVVCQPVVRSVAVGASNKYDQASRNRHSVIGASSCDEKLVSSWRQQTVQSFCRARSCPEMAAFNYLHSVHASVRHRRKMSRFGGRIRQTLPKGSEHRRNVKRILGRHNLPPPLYASWPGKGDIKGSMLAYESSV